MITMMRGRTAWTGGGNGHEAYEGISPMVSYVFNCRGGGISGRWANCGEGRWMAEEGRVTELIAFYVGLRRVGMGGQEEKPQMVNRLARGAPKNDGETQV